MTNSRAMRERAGDKVGAVLRDPQLEPGEKRLILSSWASDAHAIEGAPAYRRVPNTPHIVRLDDILEALRELDRQSGEVMASWARRQVRRASIEAFRESRKRHETRAHVGARFGPARMSAA